MKNLFVTTVAALALATSGTFAATPPKHVGQSNVVLWNQNSNFGGGVNSQNYESTMEQYDDFAADDFVIPNDQRWFISEIDLTGAYAEGSGPASSVLIMFLHTKNGHPGSVAGRNHSDFFYLSCIDNAGSFQCALPTEGRHNTPVVRLPGGEWWVSVIANCDSQTCGQWNWTESTSVAGHQAEWENPTSGWNIRDCYGWNVLNTCFGGTPADLAFQLIGFSRPIQ